MRQRHEDRDRARGLALALVAMALGCDGDAAPRGLGPGTEDDRVDAGAPACTPVRSWSQHGGSSIAFGGQPRETGVAAAALDDGGIAMLGRFLGAGSSGNFGALTLPTAPSVFYPGVITRLDASGQFLWAVEMIDSDVNNRGSLAAGGGIIAVASSTNAGTMLGDVYTPMLPPPDPNHVTIGDVFLGVLDEDGHVLWTRELGGTDSSDYYSGLVVDDAGEITIGVRRLITGGGGSETRLIHFAADGTQLWQVASASEIRDLRLGHDHTLVAAGSIADGTGGTATLARFDASNGSLLWHAGNAVTDPAVSLVAQGPGGELATLAHFSGSVTVGGQALVAQGAGDLLLQRYDAAGQLVDARALGGASDELPETLDIDGRGTTILGFAYDGATTIGPLQRASAGSYDDALAFIDADGEVLGLDAIASGPGFSRLRDVVVTSDDDLFAIGGWGGSSELGSSVGGTEIYAARLRCTDADAPLHVRDVVAVTRSAAVDRTQYFCAQTQDGWNNCQGVFLLASNGSPYDYPGASYPGAHLMVGHTFGTVAAQPFTTDIEYVADDGHHERVTAYFPAFSTAAGGGKMLFYVADDGSTYYADAEHDGYRFAADVLSPAAAMVPEHLARARP